MAIEQIGTLMHDAYSCPPAKGYFDDPFWNVHQVLAWVYTRDRSLVTSVSDDAAIVTIKEEIRLPDGGRDVLEKKFDCRNPIFIETSVAAYGCNVLPTWEVTVDAVLSALRRGSLTAYGVKNNAGELQQVERFQWAEMQFYFDPDIAGPKDLSRLNAVSWHQLKFQSEEVLELWPDPFSEPPPSATDVDLDSRITIEKKLRARAQRAAEARHSQPGGSREKQARIREIWASGKYTSRDRCAEEECAALDMAYSTARKALRNTPDPAP
ncbi:MAG: hypothetical protein KDK91_13285 [Gammaproteobacteria bacterium]|nr:hypothetical protein [Gammaproteobacteria bacterium]